MLSQCAGALVATSFMVGTSLATVAIPVRPDGQAHGPQIERQDGDSTTLRAEAERRSAAQQALKDDDPVAFFDNSTPAELAEFYGLPQSGDAVLSPVAIGDSPVTVRVNVRTNRMVVTYPGGTYQWPVATGIGGKLFTKEGTFSIVADPANINRKSRKYDDAPMPYAMFYHGGWAIHGTYQTKSLGKHVSHGCVRLSLKNVKTLFALVGHYGGATVVVSK